MEMVNTLYLEAEKISSDNDKKAFAYSLETLLLLITPFIPHVAEELNNMIGNNKFISKEKWPNYNEEYTVTDEMTIVAQINGKVRAEFLFSRNADEETIFNTVLNDEKVQSYLQNKELVKKIYVKNKLVSLVIK